MENNYNSWSNKIQLFFQHLWFMCQKELLTTLKDPRMKIVIFMSALVQGLLYGYGATYNLDNVPYAVVDNSHSQYSQSLLTSIDGTTSFERIATLANINQISDVIDPEEALVVVVIPNDFADKITSGEAAPVQIITDGRNTQVAGLAIGYMNRIITNWNEKELGLSSPIVINTRTWYNPNQESRWYFMPAIIALISFVQVLMLGGLSIAKEREQGTFDQLLVTPLTQAEILVGKAVPPMIIGITQSMILFAISLFWFHVPFAGSMVALLFTLVIFILSATGIGLSISSVANNMQQALVYIFVLIMPMALLSGMATPVSNMPESFQIATYANPMRFATEAIRRIYLEGATIPDLIGCYIPMMIIAAITLPLAGWLFRHKSV